MADTQRLDLTTLTLGELLALEVASDLEATALFRHRTGRLLAAAFILQLRAHRASPNSVPAPSWENLSARQVGDGSSFDPRSLSAGDPTTSSV